MGRRAATINSEVGTLKHVLKEGVKRGVQTAIPDQKSSASPNARERSTYRQSRRSCVL
jgi:hypothetical protein